MWFRHPRPFQGHCRGGCGQLFVAPPLMYACLQSRLFEALQTTRLVKDMQSCKYSRCGRTDKGVSALGQVPLPHTPYLPPLPPYPLPLPHTLLGIHTALSITLPLPLSTIPYTLIPITIPSTQVVPLPLSSTIPYHPYPLTIPSTQVVSLQVRSNLLEGPGVIGSEDSRVHTRKGDTSTELPYTIMLNRNLPEDIQVLGWTDVPPDFSARFSCKQRVYKYFFPRGKMDLDVRYESFMY